MNAGRDACLQSKLLIIISQRVVGNRGDAGRQLQVLVCRASSCELQRRQHIQNCQSVAVRRNYALVCRSR